MSVELLPLNALQEAVYRRLTDADKGVAQFFAAIGGRIYDEAPDRVEMPYIDFGSLTGDQGETKTREVKTFEYVIHCYSAKAGLKELNSLMDAVLRSLTMPEEELPISAPFTIASSRYSGCETFKEREEQSENVSRHGILRVTFIVQQTG